MMTIFRLLVGTTILGWLICTLGKTTVQGIQTGVIRHTDSSKVCRKKDNPAGFRALVFLFGAFIGGTGVLWLFMLADIIGEMK